MELITVLTFTYAPERIKQVENKDFSRKKEATSWTIDVPPCRNGVQKKNITK